ncbi:MAG: hypothetical protein SOU08_05185 [Anaerococcus sp.]|nr:hypothetical protein [Anaerococcus sp.]MDY2919017.1 hypothetical protein [Anaerococcus sp.]
MKKIKNLIAALMVTFLLANMVSAIAANTSDTSWSFNFGRINKNLYTESRSKQDQSPVYFYVDNFQSGDVLRVRAITGSKKPSSYTPISYISTVGKYCISSNIYEDGYRSVRVHGQKHSLFSTLKADGYWSPDSWSCGW